MRNKKDLKSASAEDMIIKNLRERLSEDAKEDLVEPQKDEESCVFCGSIDDLIEFKNSYICRKCLEDI
ncbi:MAG: hypothetical protein ACQESS_02240 [Bacillota bacterium]